jgi:hypothetical protein
MILLKVLIIVGPTSEVTLPLLMMPLQLFTARRSEGSDTNPNPSLLTGHLKRKVETPVFPNQQ